jgi:threonine/homoserine/homoserine lactone efflux protein
MKGDIADAFPRAVAAVLSGERDLRLHPRAGDALCRGADHGAGGRRAGWLSALGLHLGGYVHISAAAFGLAVLLETVPALYAALKLAGAAYLAWLGVRLLVSIDPLPGPIAASGRGADRRAIRDSILVEALNPKTALFYLAFLPQFTDLSASWPFWAQALVLGTIVSFMFSATDVACILFSDRLTRRLAASPWARRLAQRIGGGVLVALGVHLAASRQ